MAEGIRWTPIEEIVQTNPSPDPTEEIQNLETDVISLLSEVRVGCLRSQWPCGGSSCWREPSCTGNNVTEMDPTPQRLQLPQLSKEPGTFLLLGELRVVE